MSVVANRSDQIAVTVTPAQARHIAIAIRLDLAARWEGAWLHPLAEPDEVSTARSLLDECADELQMLQWGEPPGDVDLRSDRRRLGQLAQDLLEGGEERLATRDDESIAPPDVCRQGEDMIATARVIRQALTDA